MRRMFVYGHATTVQLSMKEQDLTYNDVTQQTTQKDKARVLKNAFGYGDTQHMP